MKPVQVMLDEELLARLDASEEVKKKGRSAVLRRAADEYLLRAQRWEIAERYRHAYGGGEGLGEEFAGWEDEGAWPET
jgi:metal-responsive CopG/Arc/MetJ family transcriptional regulator